MCIRDSHPQGRRFRLFPAGPSQIPRRFCSAFEKMTDRTPQPFSLLSDPGHIPVSYTHLDVYKRQEHAIPALQIKPVRPLVHPPDCQINPGMSGRPQFFSSWHIPEINSSCILTGSRPGRSLGNAVGRAQASVCAAIVLYACGHFSSCIRQAPY